MTTSQQHLLRGLTALSLVAPLASFAAPAAFQNGYYLSAKIGAQEAMAEISRSGNLSAIEDNFGFDGAIYFVAPPQDAQLFHTNFMGNLGVGYAHILKQFFLAAELSVNLATEQEMDWQITNDDTRLYYSTYQEDINVTVELENPDIIFDLRPGVLVARNTLLYSRIGVAYNKLSIEQEGSNTVISDTLGDNYVSAPISGSESEDVFGFRIGLGMEYKLTPNLAMNLDYVYTDYGSIDADFTDTNIVAVDGDPTDLVTITSTNNYVADVTKNTFTAGFNWYFDGQKHRSRNRMIDK